MFKWQIRPFKKTTNNTNVRHRYPSRAKALRCMHVSAWCVYLLKPSARDDVFTILGKLFLGNFSSRFITVFLNLQPTLLKHVCIILLVTDSPVANYKIFCQQALWFRWSYWKWWCLFLDFMFNNRIFTVGLCYENLVNFFMAWLTKLTVPI